MLKIACRRHRASMMPFLDGQLLAERQEAFLTHLSGCARCRLELERSRSALSALPFEEPLLKVDPEIHLNRFYHKLSERKDGYSEFETESEQPAPRGTLVRWIVVPATVALLAVATWYLMADRSAGKPGETGKSTPGMVEMLDSMEMFECMECFENLELLVDSGIADSPELLETLIEEEIQEGS